MGTVVGYSGAVVASTSVYPYLHHWRYPCQFHAFIQFGYNAHVHHFDKGRAEAWTAAGSVLHAREPAADPESDPDVQAGGAVAEVGNEYLHDSSPSGGDDDHVLRGDVELLSDSVLAGAGPHATDNIHKYTGDNPALDVDDIGNFREV